MANSITLSGTTIPTATSTDPQLCRVSGFLKNAKGEPLAGWHFVLRYCYVPTGLGTNTLVMQERYPIRADRSGYVEFDLIRGARFTLELPNLLPWVYKEVTVPDAASADLLGLLFPYIVSVDFEDPAAAAINVGERILVQVLATLSNGEEMVLKQSAVTLVSSNPSVLSPFETVYFRGDSPGSADITITAVDPEEADLNQDKEENDLIFFDQPTITLPASPKSVTVL